MSDILMLLVAREDVSAQNATNSLTPHERSQLDVVSFSKADALEGLLADPKPMVLLGSIGPTDNMWRGLLGAGQAHHVPVVLLAPPGATEDAVEAMRRGASDVLVMSEGFAARLPSIVRAASQRARLHAEHQQLERSLAAHAAITIPGACLHQVMAQELEARLQAERALRQSEERTRALLDALPDMMFVNRPDGVFIGYHAPQLAELAAPPKQFLGRTIHEVLPPSIADRIAASHAHVLDTGRSEVLEYGLMAGSEIRHFEAHFAASTHDEIISLVRDITERKNAQTEVEQLNRTLEERVSQRTAELAVAYEQLSAVSRLQQAILDSTSYAIITTAPDGTVRSFNPAAEQLFGYSAAEVVERATPLLWHDPDELHERSEEFSAKLGVTIDHDSGRCTVVAETHTPHEDEWRFVHRDGRRFPGVLSTTPLHDEQGALSGFLGIIRDVTQRKKTEEQLAQSLRFAQSIAEATPDIIYVMDLSARRITYANRSLQDLLGYTDEQLRTMEDAFYELVLHPDERSQLEEHLAKCAELADGQVLEREYRIRSASGEWRWLNGRDVVLERSPEGRPPLVLGIASDVTARRKAHDALQQANAELSLANTELARAGRLKDEFLASMSHELRTPLNAILGRAETLQEQLHGPLNDRQLRAVRSIEESGRHLLELINDILDLSKIEAGKLELNLTTVAVGQLCQSSLRMVAQAAAQRGISISSRIEPGLRDILADERRLKQILVNLLSNAVKFTQEGGSVGLEVTNEQDDTLQLTVWDTGIGIAAQDLPQLFEPFVQLDSRLSRQYNGTGLGLALVARMAKLHGGYVTVESTLGHGSRFTVSLPLREPDVAQKARHSLPERHARPDLPVSRPRVLLAEDNDENIVVMQEYITRHGYEVVPVKTGTGAVAAAAELHPAIILMDIQMPEMDGLDAIARIRAMPALDSIPIIALTALAMPGDRERCLAAGANDYLSKPIGLRELIRVIERFLRAGQENQS